ncbi:hypothetical protein SteCoe_17733 [Stentor coeruleus]|uniref:RING-type domain-containing protein n=1 Tax=Stentor coeruleus TaxID=5963 RepID=A0A1R2BYF7_9CILI|nr:hypothetical protein SteCoe_17733 [Stentor coeruleus]
MGHLSKRYRALGSAYNLLPICGVCNERLEENNSYTTICFDCINNHPPKLLNSNYSNSDIICKKCYESSYNFKCILCSKQLDTNPHQITKAIHNFVIVFCYKHKNIKAEFFNEENLLTFCSECKNNYSKNCHDLNQYNLYHYLEELFREQFNNYRKIIPPERRKKLIPYTTQELLESCRYFSRIMSLKCEEHFENANEIDTSLKLYCSMCEKPQEMLISIENKPEITKTLIESLINSARIIKSKYLNKLTLKIILTRTINNNSKNFEVAFEEIKRFSYKTKETYPERCVICNKFISEGNRKGIRIMCAHTMCFECIYIKNFDKCPIDYQDIQSKTQVNKILIDRIYCNCMHLIKGKAFKLPCTHMSCQACLANGKCFKCLFALNFFEKEVKEYKKSKDLIDFYLIKCPIHLENIECFSLNPIYLYCPKCKPNTRIFDENKLVPIGEISKANEYNFMIIKLDKTILKCIRLAQDNIELPSEIIKSLQYYNLLNYNDRYKIYRLLLSYGDNSIKNYESEEYIRFSKFFTQVIKTRKVFELEENEVIGVNINVSEDVYLDGLIILGMYKMILADRVPIFFSVDWIRIKRNHERDVENQGFWQDNKKLMPKKFTDIRSYGLYREQINKVRFETRIRLSSHLNYDITIKLTPGKYYHGIPYSQIPHEIFTVRRIKNIDEGFVEKGNSSIGGPLYGFIFTRCKNLII